MIPHVAYKRKKQNMDFNQAVKSIKNSEPSIVRTYHGGSERINFFEFADSVIQDFEIAVSVADTMLGTLPKEFRWNENEPEFFETFEVSNADLLRDDITAVDIALKA